WGPTLLRRGAAGPVGGRLQGGARQPRLSRPPRAVRLDRPPAVPEPRHRPQVAGGPVLPRPPRPRPARNDAGVLPPVLPRRAQRRRARRSDRGGKGRPPAGPPAALTAPGLPRHLSGFRVHLRRNLKPQVGIYGRQGTIADG